MENSKIKRKAWKKFTLRGGIFNFEPQICGNIWTRHVLFRQTPEKFKNVKSRKKLAHTDRLFSLGTTADSFFFGGLPGLPFFFFRGDVPSIFLGLVPFLLDFVGKDDCSAGFSVSFAISIS